MNIARTGHRHLWAVYLYSVLINSKNPTIWALVMLVLRIITSRGKLCIRNSKFQIPKMVAVWIGSPEPTTHKTGPILFF